MEGSQASKLGSIIMTTSNVNKFGMKLTKRAPKKKMLLKDIEPEI
jgi:hypothetical protein